MLIDVPIYDQKTNMVYKRCKIQEHILTSNFFKHLEHLILKDCQHQFRAKSSCEK